MSTFTYYFNIFKTTFRIIIKECRSYNILNFIYSFVYEINFVQGKNAKAISIAERMIMRNNSIGHYFIAKCYFVKGSYLQVIYHLELFLYKFEKHADASYLLSRAYVFLGDKTKAWKILEQLLIKSKRKRTWLELSSLIENKNEFYRFEKIWRETDLSIIKNCSDLIIRDYIAIGALRAKQYDYAINLWEETLKIIKEKKLIGDSKKNNIFSIKMAHRALSDLKLIFDQNDIDFFLISGTLLGCIREGTLLPHDKDIDIGVDFNIDFNLVIKILSSCGFFYILPKRSDNLIRIKHVNGISIDVFRHFKNANDYWHGGVKSVWHNTEFNLILYPFLGDNYKVPENYELYLTENYGKNWRKPQIDFDSTIDTPNTEIKNKYEMIAYCYKKIFEMYLFNAINNKMIRKYLNYINKLRK